jgi:hypothetical protein
MRRQSAVGQPTGRGGERCTAMAGGKEVGRRADGIGCSFGGKSPQHEMAGRELWRKRREDKFGDIKNGGKTQTQ